MNQHCTSLKGTNLENKRLTFTTPLSIFEVEGSQLTTTLVICFSMKEESEHVNNLQFPEIGL